MSDIFDKINKIKHGAMCFGLDRERAMLNKLGSPDDGLKIAHIAGTNGKGSIAEYLTRILVNEGVKVGTFTSPAVMSEWEQFRVNGIPIEPAVMSEYLNGCYAIKGDCTAFEVMTAAALLAFKEQGCTHAVVECGLGGLNDATNAVSHKEVAIISSIGREHTAILGDTIEEICFQKAGIVKDCPLVVSALQCEEARSFFEKMGARFAVPEYIESEENLSFFYEGTRYEISMLGKAQAFNAATAIEAAHILGVGEKAIAKGLKEAKLTGRIQVVVKNGNTYIVDGAHNPQAIETLVQYLSRYDAKTVKLIFGCFSDKDIAKNAELLAKAASTVIAVEPNSSRAMKLNEIAKECNRHFEKVATAKSVSDALEILSGTIAICGSFTLVKEALNWIEKEQ